MREAKFMNTEIGLFPVDWKETTIQDLGPISKGKGISRAECGTGNIPCVRYGEIYTDHDNYIKSFRSFISKEVANTSRKLHYGDLLFTGSGETKEDIGKCVAFVGNEEAYAGGDIVIVSPNLKENDPLFLGFLMNDRYIINQKALRGQGDAVVHITGKTLATVQMVLPPLDEQRRIAKTLSDIDGLISSLINLIEKKQNIKTATMQQLLTGKKRLEGFTEPWVEKKLSSFGSMLRGVSYKPEQSAIHPKPGYINLLRSNNIQNDSMVFTDCVSVDQSCISERQYMKKGDILVCTANGSKGLVGKTALYNSNDVYTFGAFMGVFRCYDVCSSVFVSYLMKSGAYKVQVADLLAGSAINNLKGSDVEDMVFLIPTDIAEQAAIASILSDMDAEISALESKKSKYESIKKGMMQELLTGKIRLV